MHRRRFQILILLLPLFLPLVPAVAATAENAPFTLTLPAETLRQAISNALPLSMVPDSNHVRGIMTIESIDRLRIHDNIIALHGVVTGKNLSMNTRVAGQDFRLRLGQVRLPVSCDVLLRFDPASNTLFLTPKFPPPDGDKADPTASLTQLLASLGSREYPVDLASLQTMHVKIGNQNVAVSMEPVSIAATGNQLILRFKPKAVQSH